ncbi:hypothetical protein ABZZ17_29650 [Streptomyces sp. NPDC006512]|uniref:hypothetical protein n=1 Tax=Streptomyces sp. NPDC006512 TaxID=3154307 RepID=UPI0033B29175
MAGQDPELGVIGRRGAESTRLREAAVLVRMVQERPRRDGHADLRRERVDGREGR